MLDNQTDGQVPAMRKLPSDFVAEYLKKSEAGPAAIAAYQQAQQDVRIAATIEGTHSRNTTLANDDVSPRQFADNLLKSAWQHVYKYLEVSAVATAKDRKRIELLLASPPDFSVENIREHFGDYLMSPRYHVLRGLAEAFTDLDPAFKSHSRVKIGVKGLPKRAVIERAFGDWGGLSNYNGEKVRDIMNALQVFRGLPRLEHAEFDAMASEAKAEGEADWPGGRIKRFKNLNAHLMFDLQGLADINRGLAEFYGEVLADSPEAEAGEVKRRASTAVSADLAYYWTAEKVVEQMIAAHDIKEGDKILEPSCGDGRIMDGIVRHVQSKRIDRVSLLGVEVDPRRADQAKSKGHNVLLANFLEVGSAPVYDLIFMNPPFAGQHYIKHINKAVKMLKPGGHLIAILPASAWYDHQGLPGPKFAPDRPSWGRDTWRDLPIGSFREAGTNVCTGIWQFWKEKPD